MWGRKTMNDMKTVKYDIRRTALYRELKRKESNGFRVNIEVWRNDGDFLGYGVRLKTEDDELQIYPITRADDRMWEFHISSMKPPYRHNHYCYGIREVKMYLENLGVI